MIYQTNCSEVVCRINLPKAKMSSFNQDLYNDIDKIMENVEPYKYDKDNSDYVIFDEGNSRIYFRMRFDGSEENKLDNIAPILNKWKMDYEIIGSQEDRPLFSLDQNFFCLLKGKIKVFDLSYVNCEFANKAHKKLLNAWKLK